MTDREWNRVNMMAGALKTIAEMTNMQAYFRAKHVALLACRMLVDDIELAQKKKEG